MQTLIFATNNRNKVNELRAVVGDRFQVITLEEAHIHIDIPEPHATLAENAAEKSNVIHRLTGKDCFGEDTGLEVTALGGEPGVKSARYAGDDRDFRKNTELLLQRLQKHSDRSARFRTVISLLLNERQHFFEGICEGHIATGPRGSAGFGYDPVFVPLGSDRSFAEMELGEKNIFSHRRKATDQLVQFLLHYSTHQTK